jgi:hypothetical protein
MKKVFSIIFIILLFSTLAFGQPASPPSGWKVQSGSTRANYPMMPKSYTVATLPTGNTNDVVLAIDCTAADDCSTGGGTNVKLVVKTATGWTILGDGSAAGAGDVGSVGDCSSGACLDGSSDGGTYIRLYDGNSHYTGLAAGDSSANLTFTFPTAYPAASGYLMLMSDAGVISTTSTLTGLNFGGFSTTAGIAVVSDGDGYLSQTITALLPDAADGATIGSAAAEWSDLYLADGGVIYFQNDQSVYLTPSASLLTLTGAFTATGVITASAGATVADSQVLTFDESAADPDDADIQLSATDGVFKIASANGANNEDITVDLDQTANFAIINSSTGLTDIYSAIPLRAPAKFLSYDAAQTLTAATHNGAMVMMTVADEVTMWDCTSSTIGHFVTLWARDAEKIEVVPATDDQFYLFNGTGIGANDELDIPATAGTKVTLMCTAANEWRVAFETATTTDGGAAD